MLIRNKIDLKKFSSFGIGGEAKYFLEVKNKKDLKEAFLFIKKK